MMNILLLPVVALPFVLGLRLMNRLDAFLNSGHVAGDAPERRSLADVARDLLRQPSRVRFFSQRSFFSQK